ncbi:MAG: DUF2155 domain-containing protein [Pacificimonas sp.]
MWRFLIPILFAMPALAQDTVTPMAERVVTIGVLDKVGQITETFTTNPGKRIRYKGLSIAVRACEATPPWAEQELTGGFLQIDLTPRPGAEAERIFSGWLYAESPSLNSVDNPAYDVWVKSCTMSWPETGPDTIVVN